MATATRRSWASSAQLHDKFGNHDIDMVQVLKDYGLESPEKLSKDGLVILNHADLSPAVAALVDLVDEHPEALALVIKHYRNRFKELYDIEVDRRKPDVVH